jgi:predicted nucleotide-binding protein (sugar kinase/HSP70/actin superfamily)
MAQSLTDFTFEGKSLVTECFIETGTFLGQTTENSAKAGFKVVKSIEVSHRLYLQALDRFKESDNSIQLYHGSSREVLFSVINSKLKTVFYLDGHYQANEADEQDNISECPLLEELQIILSFNWETLPVIIIDDAILFTYEESKRKEFVKTARLNPEHWPSIKQIEEILGEKYRIVDHDDRLYCIPK